MTCESRTIQPIKRGDTFAIVCTYKQEGQPVDVTPFFIRAQVRDLRNQLIAELAVAKLPIDTGPTGPDDNTGKFTLSAGNIDWLPGQYQCDIEFSNGGNVRSTDTFFIPVVADVTYD